MDIKLSTGAVATLMRGGEVEKPVFQILGFKKIAGQGGADRFRLNISDGQHSHTFAMLATQLNEMIPSGELDNNCVIRAEKLISNAVSEKRVLIILELTVIAKGAQVGKRIGNPVQFTEANANLGGGATNGSTTSGGNRVSSAQPAVKSEFPSKPAASFYGQQKSTPAVAPQPSPQRNNMSFGNTSLNEAGAVPIRDITPYNSKCTIKARVTNKSPVRTWSNSRGDGKLFSIDLLDESGEIRMTGFNNAVDQFYDLIKVNEVYIISKFSAKPANKAFTSLNHDYEISFSNDTQVLPCMDADSDQIPSLSFAFTEIAYIEEMDKDKIIDVVAVCKRRGDLQTLTSRKDGKELKKRDIILVDRTNVEIPLTLWGKQAEDFEDDTNPVVALKGVKVTDFNGKSLSLLNSSLMMLNPDIKESHHLRGWFDNEGINIEARSLVGPRTGGGGNAPWKMIREASGVDAAAAESGYFFKSKVTVLAIKRDNAMYKACPEEKCNKKVLDCGNGLYRCEKCAKEQGEFKWRMILNTCFGDCSDSIWATVFQEHGEILLDTKCEVLGSLHQEDPDAFDAIIKKAVFKSYTAKFRAKMETYNNENRLKYTVMDIQPINFAEYAQKLVTEMKEIMG